MISQNQLYYCNAGANYYRTQPSDEKELISNQLHDIQLYPNPIKSKFQITHSGNLSGDCIYFYL
jgi:hypothetical protein